MKIIFVSGVNFGHSLLQHILENNWRVEAVFSYDESKSKFYSDMINFDSLTSKYGIKNIKVQNINDKDNIEIIKEIAPDIILVMGWSQLLKVDTLKIPKIGIIGSHPTELPKFRGRAPIPWSIIKNLKESALTFFWIEEGTDTGNILDQQKFFISEEDNATSLYEKITNLGKKMIIENLNRIKKGEISKTKQDESKFIENWSKRTPEDGHIDWSQTAKEIHTLIRASTHPYPGAFTYFKKKKLLIWKSIVLNESVQEPGKILDIDKNGIQIGTGNGVIKLLNIDLEGSKAHTIKEIFSQNDIGVVLS